DKQKDDQEQAGEAKSTLFANSDLFDAENEEENTQGENHNKEDNSESDSGDSSDSSREGNEDEGFDESSLDPKLLAKLKKGAAKKPSRKTKEKSRKDELLDIHSETQRIVRESRVNLPYHQPEPKPLSAFLARASRKQELYKSLHNTRDIHKAKIMQQTFEKDKTNKESEGNKTMQSTSEKVTEKTSNIEATEGSEKIVKDTEEEISAQENVSEDAKEKHLSSEVHLGEDDLPDLEEREKEVRERLGQNDSPKLWDEQAKLSLKDEGGANCENSVDSEGDISNTQCTDSTKTLEKQSAKSNSEEIASQNRTEHTTTQESKLSFLLEPDLPHMSAVPKLSGGPDAVISLDEEEEEEPQNPGVRKLMGRFMDHCKKRTKHVNKDVDIRIVEKDKDELHMKTFTYHPTQEDESSLQAIDAPGAKLVALKEKLQEKMKVKREESRKQRQDVYDLDNEEGYTAEDEDAILDNDDEMSEHSDTDVEDDEFDEEFGEDEEMEEEEEREKEKNPFADDEAEEDDGDDDGGCESDEDVDNLKLHLSDDDDDDVVEDQTEDEKDQAIQIKSSAKKKKPRVLQISDDEESRDVTEEQEKATNEEGQSGSDPNKERAQEDKTDDKGLFKEPLDDMFVPFSMHGSQATQAQEVKRTSSLIPPVEDSQDLYGTLPAIPSTCMDSQQSQTLNFYIEESQSRMFDNDGFLRTGSTAKKPKSKPYMSFDMDSSQENFDELLGLCSGRFQENDKKGSCKQQLFGTQTDTQNNMEQLMGLCSGKFAESQVDGGRSQKTGVKRKSPLDEEEEDSSDSFKLVSDNEEEDEDNRKNVFSDEERIEEEEEEEDGKGPQQEKFKGFTIANKHG
ncbi:claspin-like, partial [Saccostrea cucullata]|uniref:claspin-like n=1 Tax=Saccostrea cuccullata TaxID=36930 RepID=UPI002ED68092